MPGGPAQLPEVLARGALSEFIVEAAGLRASSLCSASTSRLRYALCPQLEALFPARVCVAGGERPDALAAFKSSARPIASCQYLDPVTGCWEALPRLPTARSRCAAAGAGALLYVVGGRCRRGTQPIAAVERFDADAWAWTALAALPTPRFALGAALLGGRLYAVGGSDGRKPLDVTERFCPRRGAWEALPPLPSPHEGLTLAAAAGRVLAAGGTGPGGQPSVPAFWGFDPSAHAWEVLTEHLPLTPRQCALVAAPGRLFLLGGRSGGEEDPRSGAATAWLGPSPAGPWRPLPGMTTARSGAAVAAAGGLLVAAGGYRELRPCGHTEVLELAFPEKGWQWCAPIPHCGYAAGACLRVPRRRHDPSAAAGRGPSLPPERPMALPQLDAWLSSLLGQSAR